MKGTFLILLLACLLIMPAAATAGDCGYEALPIADVCWCCNLFFGCYIEGYEQNGGAACFIGSSTSYCVDYGVMEVEACDLSYCVDLGYFGRGFAYRHIAYSYPNVPFCGGGAENAEPCIIPDNPGLQLMTPIQADINLAPAPTTLFPVELPIESAQVRVGK